GLSEPASEPARPCKASLNSVTLPAAWAMVSTRSTDDHRCRAVVSTSSTDDPTGSVRVSVGDGDVDRGVTALGDVVAGVEHRHVPHSGTRERTDHEAPVAAAEGRRPGLDA